MTIAELRQKVAALHKHDLDLLGAIAERDGLMTPDEHEKHDKY